MQTQSNQHSRSRIAASLGAHREIAHQLFARPVCLPVTSRTPQLPLLFWSQVAWDTVWQRPQEQALGLAAHRQVIWISPVQVHELVSRLKDRWQPVRRLEGGRLTVLSPIIFSGEYRSLAVRKANRRLIGRMIRRIVGKSRDFLFMTNTPFCQWIQDEFEPRATIYDLIDDFCGFEWAPKEGVIQEDRLISRADLLLAGTGFLQERFRPRFPALEFLPSGVRFDDLRDPAPEPEDLAKLPHPRALYVGTLNDRLDGELFQATARAVGEGSVAVVGPKHGTFRAPDLPDNVHFLGLKPHDQLRGYYQHCDLGIMPFADSPAARAINPVKTLEYLACGLPVLSTPVPDVIKYYPDVVRVEAAPAWESAARELLDSESPQLQEQRVEFARDRSWAKLVEHLQEHLLRLERNR